MNRSENILTIRGGGVGTIDNVRVGLVWVRRADSGALSACLSVQGSSGSSERITLSKGETLSIGDSQWLVTEIDAPEAEAGFRGQQDRQIVLNRVL